MTTSHPVLLLPLIRFAPIARTTNNECTRWYKTYRCHLSSVADSLVSIRYTCHQIGVVCGMPADPSVKICTWRQTDRLPTTPQMLIFISLVKNLLYYLYSSILIPRKVGIGRVYNIFFYVKKLTAQLKSGD